MDENELKKNFLELLYKNTYVLSSNNVKRFIINFDKANNVKKKMNIYNRLLDFEKYGASTLRDLKLIKNKIKINVDNNIVNNVNKVNNIVDNLNKEAEKIKNKFNELEITIIKLENEKKNKRKNNVEIDRLNKIKVLEENKLINLLKMKGLINRLIDIKDKKNFKYYLRIEINRNNYNVDIYDSSYKNLEPFNLSINNDENIDKSIQKINEISQNEAILNIYDFKYSINPFKKATFL